MWVQDLVRLHSNIAVEVPVANVISFQKTCVTLVRKFNGVWNKADGPSTTKSGQTPKKATASSSNKNVSVIKQDPQVNKSEKPRSQGNEVNFIN